MSTWSAIAALANYEDEDGDLTLPMELGNGVRLVAMPDWARSDSALEDVDGLTRARVQESCSLALQHEYEADALFSPDNEWRGSKPRSLQDKATERIVLANLSMWLAKPAPLQLAAISHFSHPPSGDSLQQILVQNGPIVHEWDVTNRLAADDLAVARKLNEQLLSVNRHGTTSATVRLLIASLHERAWDTRYVLSWIAMESLFGSEQEIQYRLSQRVAFFLASHRSKAREIFQSAKEGYGWRSRLVHGRGRSKTLTDKESLQLSHRVQEFLRLALIRILTDPDLIATFDGSKRDEFLDHLVFSTKWDPSGKRIDAIDNESQ